MKLEITEWQRVYLAEYIVQSEIDDQETWLEYEESEVMKDVIKPRLDALRKLKAFLDVCGKEEERKPLPWKAAAKKYMELLQEQEADRQMLVNASLWARAWKAAAKKFRALTFKFWVARRWARAWKERAKHYKNDSDVCLETARNFARYYEKACKELNAHGLLQDFLARLEKEEGGEQ